MKLTVKNPKVFAQSGVYLSTMIRALLNILLVVIVFALAVGVYKSGDDLFHSLHKPLETILQQILLDTVFIVALVEIANTIVGYLQDGRVHVRYIVDTILIIMLNEVVSGWFKHPTLEHMSGLALILVVLTVVRIGVTKLSPDR